VRLPDVPWAPPLRSRDRHRAGRRHGDGKQRYAAGCLHIANGEAMINLSDLPFTQSEGARFIDENGGVQEWRSTLKSRANESGLS